MAEDIVLPRNRLWYIAQAHSYFPSTYANNYQVMKMCSAFAATGVQTALVVPYRMSTGRALKNMQTSLWEFYGVPSSFEITWLPFPYPVARFQRSVHALIVVLYALVKRFRLAYTRSEWVSVTFARLGIPTLLEIHHYSEGPAQALAAKTASNRSFLGLVCVSQALADKMIELGFPAEKVLVAHDGVDLDRFEPRLSQAEARVALNFPIDGQIVCHLGHLYQGRGMETLLSSAEILQDTIFLIVGGHPQDIEGYQDRARERGLENLRFTGVVPNRKVPTYLYAADVLVMPYTRQTPTYEYMSPMKMFEYMAAGRPIVSSDFSVLREILRHEENALLISPSDAPALTRAIQRVLSDTALAQSLGRQALRDVRVYTWERRARRILDFIEASHELA